MARSNRPTARQPATKFPNLQKKLRKTASGAQARRRKNKQKK